MESYEMMPREIRKDEACNSLMDLATWKSLVRNNFIFTKLLGTKTN